MNKRTGMVAAVVTLAAVIGFALAMLADNVYASYLSSLFISWGFILMICTFTAFNKPDRMAAGYAAIAFAGVYGTIVGLVYFAQLTTVHLSELNDQASALLDYSRMGSLFFNYDLLGYAFMAISTFFAGLALEPEHRGDRWLKRLLMIHGIFALSCILMPMLGIFHPGMAGGPLIGVLVLEFWCTYFTPVCLLAFGYFKRQL